MESISDAYCAIDADWRYVYMNRAGYALLNREPADSVVGKVIWDEMDITPEFEAAYRRARDEQVPVEVTGYYAPWDRWIHNRVLPTAGGLSIFARDATEERRRGRLVGVGSDVAAAVDRAGRAGGRRAGGTRGPGRRLADHRRPAGRHRRCGAGRGRRRRRHRPPGAPAGVRDAGRAGRAVRRGGPGVRRACCSSSPCGWPPGVPRRVHGPRRSRACRTRDRPGAFRRAWTRRFLTARPTLLRESTPPAAARPGDRRGDRCRRRPPGGLRRRIRHRDDDAGRVGCRRLDPGRQRQRDAAAPAPPWWRPPRCRSAAG